MNVERVACITLGLVAGFFVFGLPTFFSSMDKDNSRNKSKFQIVDRYKNCDVIQYSQNFVSSYKYFLHCSTPQ
jgi:hypothetical protein